MSYEISVKVKNGELLKTMRANGINTAAELSRASNLSQSIIGKMLNLKLPPFNKNGIINSNFEKLTELFNCTIFDLCPIEHMNDPLLTNENTFEVESQAELQAMIGGDWARLGQMTIEQIESKEEAFVEIDESLSKLTEKEQFVIKMYFTDGKTLDKIGCEMGVGRERVSQIRNKALRKLRSSICTKYEVSTQSKSASLNDVSSNLYSAIEC